jgi:hypothetical protein
MEIKYVCSLGPWCHIASLLKKNNLKLASYPFDWIFSNQDTIIHCLEDNFKTFLDKSNYIDISDTKCGHTVYHPEMFNHHNLLRNENDYNYYIRCSYRFQHLLKCDEPKLFITGCFNMNVIDESVTNSMIFFNTKLSKHTQNYTLLVIFHLPNKKNNHVFTYKDNIHFLELHTLTRSHGIFFDNENDNTYLDNILMQTYNFNLTPIK